MADVVRLSVVYDTQQAASNLSGLNRQLGITHSSARRAGLGALQLAQSFEDGTVSATKMASSLASLGTFIAGPWGLAIAFAAAGLTFFLNRQQKVREESRKFADQLRDTKRSVDELISGRGKTPFESEIQHLSDLIEDLDRKIKDANSSWTTMLQGGLAVALQALGFGGIGRALMPKAPPESAAAAAERKERARLLAEGPFAGIQNRAASDQRNSRNLARLLGTSQIDMMSDSLDRAKKELEDLIAAGLDPLGKVATEDAAAIKQGEEQLRRMTRAAVVMRSGLQTLADSIEEFVVTGKLAFTDFLNSILRLLYRDFTGSIIDSILRSAGASGSHTTGGSGGVQVGGDVGGGGITGSIQGGAVNFHITAMDSQDVARWVSSNGQMIAAEVSRQFSRSSNLRRVVRRG